MPPKRATKRKAPTTYPDPPSTAPPPKKPTHSASKSSQNSTVYAPGSPEFNHSRWEETHGIVQRTFYPPVLSDERCQAYINNELPRPIEELESAISDTAEARSKIPVGEAVVHWFKRDLRTHDNRGLSEAGRLAKEHGVPLICLFIVSPQDYQAHFTSPARVDFELRTLGIMKEDLGTLDVPLHVETQEKRKRIPGRVVELCKEWGVRHVFANMEYEVDELRRDAGLTRKCLEEGISFTVLHDDVVVPPGRLMSGQGKQYSVYSPWFRAWIAYLHENPELLDEFPAPGQNPPSARERYANIFAGSIPSAPENKLLSPEEKERFEQLWPAGEHAALDRLTKFLDEKIGRYKDTRNFPAAGSTAIVSVHHSAGTLAARTSVRQARDVNKTKKLDGGHEGIKGWIGEVAWRDFYKHVLVHWPYVCMHKPFKYEYAHIEWEYNDEQFKAWCDGRTGYPIVDAAMRQLNHSGYMHNRCRMIVASFISKHLLLDWRLGERYFMEHLIDGDFASNNGGWGFSASVGVDPQPYFRIFNPLLQSERFDPDGEYIRKWVEELSDIHGKAIHDPYGRGEGKKAEAAGYPKMIVEHRFARERALARYKEGVKRE